MDTIRIVKKNSKYVITKAFEDRAMVVGDLPLYISIREAADVDRFVNTGIFTDEEGEYIKKFIADNG